MKTKKKTDGEVIANRQSPIANAERAPSPQPSPRMWYKDADGGSRGATSPTIEQVPVALIAFSATNPRRHKDNDAFTELKASIEALGVQVPVRVRPLAPADPCSPQGEALIHGLKYELIMGERRLRACQALKFETIPAVIEATEDLDAFKAQLAENLQREELTALEEGAAYATAMQNFGLTAEQVAEEFGVKRSTVFARLRLHGLQPEVQKALVEHQIPDSIATLVATIPDPKAQVKAAKEIAEGTGWEAGVALTFREAQDLIERDYRKSLKGAPFDVKDATLRPEAGPCTTCPKRSGNLDPDGANPNICTDPACYTAKVRAVGERAAEKWVAQGHELVPAADMEKQWQTYGDKAELAWSSKFVKASAQPHQDKKKRSVKQLMEGSGLKAFVGIDPVGGAHLLFLNKDVEKRLKELGIVKEPKSDSAGGSRGATSPTEQAKAEREQKLAAAAGTALVAALVKALESPTLSEKRERAVWVEVLGWLSEYDVINHDAVCARRGWTNDALQKHAESLNAGGVLALVVEALCYESYDDVPLARYTEGVAKALDLDVKAIEKKARAEAASALAKAEAAAKAKEHEDSAEGKLEKAEGKLEKAGLLSKKVNAERSTSNVQRSTTKKKAKAGKGGRK